ncbi:MAG: MFS transporter, partial [Pseudomonas sp.]
LLVSATGAGALAAALYLAARKSVRGLSKVITASAIVFALALLLFASSRLVWLCALALLIAGFGMMLQMAASNTFLQTIVDDDKRGRILSLYTMAYIGTAPLGSLLLGLAAHYVGAPIAVAVGASLALVGAAVFGRQLPTFREHVRPIYRAMGIIPEVATGIQAATQTRTTEES